MSAPLPPLGLFNQMWALAGVSDRTAVAAGLEHIRLADALDFASVWIGEHHVPPGGEGSFHGRVPASEIFLAHAAALTKRITLGTGVKILATSSALRCAEEMMTLHLLAPGRFEFGLGMGPTRPGDPESRAEKAARYRARLDAILGHLAGEPATSLQGCPELARRLWVAARDEPTIRFAAGRGLNLVVGQAEIARRQAAYVRQYRAAGGTGEVRGARLAFVAETAAEARAQCREATEIYFAALGNKGYHAEAVAAGLLPPEAGTPEEKRRQLDFLAGTPDEVAQALNAYAAEVRIDRLDVMAEIPGLPADATRRSLALIAAEVRPRLGGVATGP